jgi:hypothetical protein
MVARCALSFVLGGLLVGLVGYASKGLSAEQTQGHPVAWSGSGMRAEEVRVGQSCVVIVTRGNSGVSDHVAAVPCGSR